MVSLLSTDFFLANPICKKHVVSRDGEDDFWWQIARFLFVRFYKATELQDVWTQGGHKNRSSVRKSTDNPSQSEQQT